VGKQTTDSVITQTRTQAALLKITHY